MRLTEANVLVVPPFECAWLMGEEARFAEPGKACVAFEAMTENDVTVVFKELAGSKHYRTDSGPSYTLILGSHRNRRLKIEVDGQTVVDVASAILQPTHFERYWINVFNGVLTVGKGDPGKGVVYQWVDSKPNCKVQYVGLSSWDKHVVYRSIQVLPPLLPATKQMPCDSGGFAPYMENEELADVQFIVGPEEKIVPAHKILLALCCSKFIGICTSSEDVIHIPLVQYPTLHALIQYIYTGHTQVYVDEIHDLRDLANDFGFQELVTQCEELINVTGIDSDAVSVRTTGQKHKVDLEFKKNLEKADTEGAFLHELPIDVNKLGKVLESGDYTDVELAVDGHAQVVQAHRLILSAWSNPFVKMFTNGMCETKKNGILIRDVGLEVLLAMINFMYKGHLEFDDREDVGSILLPLMNLADRFGIRLLQQKCINYILESLTEDSACAVLQVAATMPICQALCESCEQLCAKHFDFCTAPPAHDFQQLEASSLQKILQHSDLRVTSEEKVLDAVILWAVKKDEIRTWQDASSYLDDHVGENLFSDLLADLGMLLPLVRFPLMSLPVLQQVLEALEYLGQNSHFATYQSEGLSLTDMSKQGRLVRFPKSTLRFTSRPSTYKELQYICDGDRNGVFYFIGTSFGLHPWMNPVLTKRMSITASSPPARFTDMKTLVSGNYQGTSFAGPCMEGGRISSWWKVDLGKDHKLICNYYTVRQDGSTNFMRSWSLQGSNDGDNWINLCSHENDQTMCRPGQYASWPVHGASPNLPFRFFRIILTSPTTSAMNPWNFCLCYLELYGYFQ